MSYRANLDIVIALNNLQITSFRKQGYLRFKLTLLQRTQNTPPSHKKKVQHIPHSHKIAMTPTAVPTTSTNSPTTQQSSPEIFSPCTCMESTKWMCRICRSNCSNPTSTTTKSATTREYYSPNFKANCIESTNAATLGSTSIPKISNNLHSYCE